jgi:transketolase
VLTHDSIGLGEDGPTHQPVEHLASLRAIPNVHVFRPGDAVETAEAWELAIRWTEGPTVLALTRQNLPTLRTEVRENCSARGGYVLQEASGPRRATLIATGSELQVAVAARAALEEEGVPVAVVSLPCWELFATQDEAYRAEVLGSALRVGSSTAAASDGLGPLARPDGNLHRHAGLRRQRAGGGAVPPFRHHAEAASRRVGNAGADILRAREAGTWPSRSPINGFGRIGRWCCAP